MKLKKILVIVLMCLTVALIVVGAVFIFKLNDKEKETPTNLQVYEIDDKFYLFCNAKEGEEYIFKIEQNFSQNKDEEFIEVAKIEEDSNMICLNDYDQIILKLGEYLRFSVCYKGETESANSKYSNPLVWQVAYTLDTPNIFKSNDTIVWDYVENADFYNVYYQLKDGVLKSLTTTDNYVDTSKLYGGVYNVCVEAVSNKEYYLKSQTSEFKELTVTRQVEEFLYAIYDNYTYTLTITSKEVVNEIKIENVGTLNFDDKYFTHSINNDGFYIYKITNMNTFISILGNIEGATVTGRYDEYNTWCNKVAIQ